MMGMTSTEASKRLHIVLPSALLAKLKQLSAKTGAPVAELVRRAIIKFVGK